VQLSPAQPGDILVDIANHKAQAVVVTVAASGPWPEDHHAEPVELDFQPGPPANIDLRLPPQITVGESVYLEGAVTDLYGNAVLDGTGVSLAVSAGSTDGAFTKGGLFRSSFSAPTALNAVPGRGEQVSVTAGAGEVSSRGVVQVLPGSPANIALTAPASEVPADGKSTVTLTGEVSDLYGNAVLDETPVSLSLVGEGSLSLSSAVTREGRFSVHYTAGTRGGTAAVTARAGRAAGSLDITLAAATRKEVNFKGRTGYYSTRSVIQVGVPRDQVLLVDYRRTGGSDSRWVGLYVYPEGTSITFYGYDKAYGWTGSYYHAVQPAAVLQGYGLHRLYLPAGNYLFIPSSDAYVCADYEIKLEFSVDRALTASPPPVAGLTGRAASDLVNRLAWDEHPEAGPHAYYLIYRWEQAGSGLTFPVLRARGVLSPRFADAGVTPGKAYYYAVSFVDEGGLESPLSGVLRVDVPTTYRVEDGNRSYVTYRNGPNGWFGVWETVSDARYSEGSAHVARPGYYGNYGGVEAEVIFRGTGLNLVTARRSAGVYLDVYLDGQYLKQVKIPGGPDEYQLVLPLATGLAYGDHRIRLVLVSNTPFAIDAVEIATQ